MLTIVSGCHPGGWDLYGKKFIGSFTQYWPREDRIIFYTEKSVEIGRGENRSVWECDGLRGFVDTYSKELSACGREPSLRWKEKERRNGYSYRFDAVKFCKQLFYPEHAAASVEDGELLVWFDADVEAFKPVPQSLVVDLIGDAQLAYLGRGERHSELGFWAVRLDPMTRQFLSQLSGTYRSSKVFSLTEWHSAFVFDAVRRLFEKRGLRTRDLTPGGTGHVWFQCALGRYTDHMKGDRKNVGRSFERGR